MLLASFFPLAVLILAVLGTIVFGLATPTEAAAVGSFGGFVLAAVYALLNAAAGAAQPHPQDLGSALDPDGVSIVWFLLLKFEVLESGPPLWVGWVIDRRDRGLVRLRRVPGAAWSGPSGSRCS